MPRKKPPDQPEGNPPNPKPMNQVLDRYKGCLFGLAVGDALGTTLEFSPPGTFEPIEDLVGGGAFHLVQLIGPQQ